MKKYSHYFISVFSVFVFSGTFMNGTAQTTCGTNYHKGQKFHYSRIDKPDIILQVPGYQQMSKKEKKAAEENFNTGVAAGTIQGKNYDFDMSISDVKSGSNGNIYEFEYDAGTAKYFSYIVCSNDTMYAIRANKPTATLNAKKDTVGFYNPGLVQYPMAMKVGDLLPVTVDVAYSFPKDVDLSTQRRVLDHVLTDTYTKESQGYIYTTTSTTSYYKDITDHLSYTLEFNTFTNTYRHVVAEDSVNVGGKSYKAFKIEMIFETHVGDLFTNVNADNMFSKWSLNIMNKLIKNNINDSPELKRTGYEWFVPQLGVIAKSEILDTDGSAMYYALLKSVE